MALVTGALPKSKAGRQAASLDNSLVTELLAFLSESPTQKDEDGEDRPSFAGDGTEFDTQGKAASAGRRYAKKIAADMETTVRVNVALVAGKADTKSARYGWRIYIPLSEAKKDSENGSE